MPSTKSRSIPNVLLSSTVITPSLPTLSKASAMRLAHLGGRPRRCRPPAAPSPCRSTPAPGRPASSPTAAATAVLHAPLEAHRVGAGRDVAHALVYQGLGQHGGGGGAVAGDVVGLGGDLLHELGAHVLELVVELHLSGDRHAVVGDGRRAELLVEDHVAALGAESDLHRVGELVGTPVSRPRRASSSNLRILGIGDLRRPWPARRGR